MMKSAGSNKKFRLIVITFALALSFSFILLIGAPNVHPEYQIATVVIENEHLKWIPNDSFGEVKLTVSGPAGLLFEKKFESGKTPYLDISQMSILDMPDGSYNYELRAAPLLSPQAKQALESARESEYSAQVSQDPKMNGIIPSSPMVQTGSFAIADGLLVMETESEIQSVDQDEVVFTRDQQILDDLIVIGSGCIGQDCVNGESFGFDTLRLKENNLRIKFQDTSNSASFPTNDWQLTANDSSNGGANKFSIDDIDGGRTPFTIEAGARSNSLYIDDGGKIGLGTSTPVVEMHVIDGDTPTLRLEQDGSLGWPAQTWDVAGNEANFFIRDITNGSKLPFRIKPGSPGDSIYIYTDKVSLIDGDANESTFAADEVSLLGGAVKISEDAQEIKTISMLDDGLTIDEEKKVRIGNSLEIVGDITIAGSFAEGSDVNSKENFSEIDPREILDRVIELPITTWNFKKDTSSVRHMGPTSQDFYKTFDLGKDEKTIAPRNMSAVALAAIKGLSEKKDAEIQLLKKRIEKLEALVQATLKPAESE